MQARGVGVSPALGTIDPLPGKARSARPHPLPAESLDSLLLPLRMDAAEEGRGGLGSLGLDGRAASLLILWNQPARSDDPVKRAQYPRMLCLRRAKSPGASSPGGAEKGTDVWGRRLVSGNHWAGGGLLAGLCTAGGRPLRVGLSSSSSSTQQRPEGKVCPPVPSPPPAVLCRFAYRSMAPSPLPYPIATLLYSAGWRALTAANSFLQGDQGQVQGLGPKKGPNWQRQDRSPTRPFRAPPPHTHTQASQPGAPLQ